MIRCHGCDEQIEEHCVLYYCTKFVNDYALPVSFCQACIPNLMEEDPQAKEVKDEAKNKEEVKEEAKEAKGNKKQEDEGKRAVLDEMLSRLDHQEEVLKQLLKRVKGIEEGIDGVCI